MLWLYLTAVCLAGFAEEPATGPTPGSSQAAQAAFNAQKAQRIAVAERSLMNLKSGLAKLPPQQKAERQAQIRELDQQLKAIRESKFSLGPLDIEKLQAGQIGKLDTSTGTSARVVRIIDESSFVATLESNRPARGAGNRRVTCIFRQMPTEGLAEGQPHREISGMFQVLSKGEWSDEEVFIVEPVTAPPETEVGDGSADSAQPAKPRSAGPSKSNDTERQAASALNQAKALLKQKDPKQQQSGQRRLEELIEKYPSTQAAAEARTLLK